MSYTDDIWPGQRRIHKDGNYTVLYEEPSFQDYFRIVWDDGEKGVAYFEEILRDTLVIGDLEFYRELMELE